MPAQRSPNTADPSAVRRDALGQLEQIEMALAAALDQLSRGLNLALYQVRRMRMAQEQEDAES